MKALEIISLFLNTIICSYSDSSSRNCLKHDGTDISDVNTSRYHSLSDYTDFIMFLTTTIKFLYLCFLGLIGIFCLTALYCVINWIFM